VKDENEDEGGEKSLFFDPEDGYFDISEFLSSKAGFLPLAIPITEPAIGYGLSLGLSYFHSTPKRVPGVDGEAPRVIMPSTTVLLGAGTENGTWATGLAHLGTWNEGRIRYLGAAGYAALDLDWYGRSDALDGRAIAYTNDVFFFFQQIRFQIGDSGFFLGPQYRFFSSEATFDASEIDPGIPAAELDSQTSGLGVDFSYDSLDQPYSPTRGWRAGITVSDQATWLGGDFDYVKAQSYVIKYFPLSDRFVLGLRLNVDAATDEAPFYDLPGLMLRGIPRGRFVDDRAVYGEAELRWDFTDRWTTVGFVGAGRVANEFDDLPDADTHAAAGGGIRYLIARQYGLRMGVDLAYGDDEWTLYVGVGTGWVRP
jgi:hypothetical protein